jgi:REase_DpnII-MboI
MSEGDDRVARIPTRAFGRTYKVLPEHVRADLDTLQREGAIYADHWIEEIGDFRHVRIAFTDEERRDYARRAWAYELWLRAGQPHWAMDTPAIDADVAKEADTYVLHTIHGDTFGPPYHCFAAFLGDHLEALVCGMEPERQKVVELHGREAILHDVKRVIDSLTPTIRSFNNREKGLSPWAVTREDDARDLLYVMLRPIVFDLAKEEAVPSRAGTHKLVDLYSKAVKLFLEVKWIAKRGQWKRIVEEIHVDVQCYVSHPSCDTLVFVIVDAARDVPDPRCLERELSCTQVIEGRSVDVRVYIAEP